MKIYTFSFNEMHLEILSGKFRPSCLGFQCVQIQSCHNFAEITTAQLPWLICCGLSKSVSWGSFHERFFHRISNLMKISFCSHLSGSKVIAMKVCTCHDSSAVMACGKFCGDMINHKESTLKHIFHRIWMGGLENHIFQCMGKISYPYIERYIIHWEVKL